MWCIARVDGEYVARMEDVLDLYAEKPDKKHPVVCFDESPQQLIGEVREPMTAVPGQVQRYDSEYKRNGTANLFVMLDVHQPWRQVKVTDHRAGEDFAECMRDLVDRTKSTGCSTARRLPKNWLMPTQSCSRMTMSYRRQLEPVRITVSRY
jgi:hypothetical protein